MAGNWLRRIIMLAACASVALLAGCGSSVESALTPSRFISFGDAFSDVRQYQRRQQVHRQRRQRQQLDAAAGGRLWPEHRAFEQRRPGLCTGQRAHHRHARRRRQQPPRKTVTQQIDAFLASNTLQPNDVVLINGGISDIVAEWAAMTAGTETQAQMTANVTQAAKRPRAPRSSAW